MIAFRSLAVRTLIQAHRWLGLLLGLVVMVWFASGIGMIYAGGMPALTPQARIDHLPALQVDRIRLAPAEAALRMEGPAAGEIPVLAPVLGRPAYRFAASGSTVFADDGSVLEPVDEQVAAEVARQFLGDGAPELRFVRRIEAPDQWTLSLRRALPLLEFRAGDDAGTRVYVAARTAEVVLTTTRHQRLGAWVATIPHWLYFSSLRQNQPLWYRLVVTLAAAACVLAVLGLTLAFTQWRRTRPLDLKRAIPYRGGMRWHYISGALFGFFALTWAFSGLLSMEPFRWTREPELQLPPDALSGGAPELEHFDIAALAALPDLAAPRIIKEVAFQRIHGAHYFAISTSQTGEHPGATGGHQAYGLAAARPASPLLVAADPAARHDTDFPVEDILQRLRAALPRVPLETHALLTDYDDYYYARDRRLPLPVLRVKLGDPQRTWLYVDPASSRLLASVHRRGRLERWLYKGLHSLDFRFWHAKRPLWDLVMIILLLGGLATSSLGFWFGVRRLTTRSSSSG